MVEMSELVVEFDNGHDWSGDGEYFSFFVSVVFLLDFRRIQLMRCTYV